MPAVAAAASIEGTVTDAGTAEPVQGANVCAYAWGAPGVCTTTGENGSYSITGLESDSYKVEFESIEAGLNYITQYYNGKATFEKAEWVTVLGESATTGVNAALVKGGRITGIVTDESTSEPIEGITVCAFVIGTAILSCDKTDAAGEYAVIGLPTGTAYKVEFAAAPESGLSYQTEFYNNKFSFMKGNPVSVVAGSTTSGIDAALTPIP
ncbi:MAG TPA: carboxypeptidase-like regulatory domain-containing protein [Solirubrobacterales bacterium]|nr:carboxypeptidase-like regulatory domain-containing protein [Solirubrobacterales bacterium]